MINGGGEKEGFMAAADDVRAVLAMLQAALTQAAGRIGELGMRVDALGVDLKTQFKKKASGELDLRLVKIGGGGSEEQVSTISLTMEPTEVVSASHVDDELAEALTVIEAALATLEADFALTAATVEVAFATHVDGKISVVFGGEVSRERTHIARVSFEPAGSP
jgi:hypothetical protein